MLAPSSRGSEPSPAMKPPPKEWTRTGSAARQSRREPRRSNGAVLIQSIPAEVHVAKIGRCIARIEPIRLATPSQGLTAEAVAIARSPTGRRRRTGSPGIREPHPAPSFPSTTPQAVLTSSCLGMGPHGQGRGEQVVNIHIKQGLMSYVLNFLENVGLLTVSERLAILSPGDDSGKNSAIRSR